jgi:hypothetical protein
MLRHSLFLANVSFCPIVRNYNSRMIVSEILGTVVPLWFAGEPLAETFKGNRNHAPPIPASNMTIAFPLWRWGVSPNQ